MGQSGHGMLVRYPMTLRQGLVSVLHRNSGIPCEMPALASRHDTLREGKPSTGHSDEVPVCTHRGRTTCKSRALFVDQECFT